MQIERRQLLRSFQSEKRCQLFGWLPTVRHLSTLNASSVSSHGNTSTKQLALVPSITRPVVEVATRRVWECQLRRRYQMIKQKMEQMACPLLGELCAKNLLGDREAMSMIQDNHHEFVRFYTHMNLGRSREVSDEISRVANL